MRNWRVCKHCGKERDEHSDPGTELVCPDQRGTWYAEARDLTNADRALSPGWAEALARHVPEHLHDALVAYTVNHSPTGAFLKAVLSNNLLDAVGRADENSLRGLRGICQWIYNYAPSDCHGSNEAVSRWLKGSAPPISIVASNEPPALTYAVITNQAELDALLGEGSGWDFELLVERFGNAESRVIRVGIPETAEKDVVHLVIK